MNGCGRESGSAGSALRGPPAGGGTGARAGGERGGGEGGGGGGRAEQPWRLHRVAFSGQGGGRATRADEGPPLLPGKPGEPSRVLPDPEGGAPGPRAQEKRPVSRGHLNALENQSIYIIREAFRKFRDLAMLWSMGKDSTTILWLGRQACFRRGPFPLLPTHTN